MAKDEPQVPIDPPSFMLSPISMNDVEYQTWNCGINYTNHILGDDDYSIRAASCLPLVLWYVTLSILFSLVSYFTCHITCVVTSSCIGLACSSTLVELLDFLLMLLIYLGRFMTTSETRSLGSVL